MDAFLKQSNLKYCSRTTAPWIGRRALIPWCQVWLQGGAECLCLYSMFIMCLMSSGFAFNWSQPFSPHSSPIINDQHHNPAWLPNRQGVLYNCGLFNRLLIKHSYWINKLRGGCWGNIFPKHSRVAKPWTKVCVLRALRVVCQWLYWQMLLTVCAFLWGVSRGLLRAARGSRVTLSGRWTWLLQEVLNLWCCWRRSQVPGTRPSPCLPY